jgi:hypothetical protein
VGAQDDAARDIAGKRCGVSGPDLKPGDRVALLFTNCAEIMF